MQAIIRQWKLDLFPSGSAIPRFRFSVLIGPDYYDEVFETVASIAGCTIEHLDFDTGELSVNRLQKGSASAGDSVYVLYNTPEEWVGLFVSDLQWGILFSNVSTSSIVERETLAAALLNFEDSYALRCGRDAAYYNQEILKQWAGIQR